ncbi:MAG TPA: BMC domain-containing protein [bacterium]|nr:BMC domain-containing protein [bacterium]HPN42711.1 BMC domain-containing protein [bacterium]
MAPNAIGLLELNSIAAGIDVADTMLKSANVQLALARTICSGKYLVIVGGEVAAVRSSVEAGKSKWPGAVIDSIVLANIDAQVFPAIAGSNKVDTLAALGIIESFSVSALVEAADAAVKAANVQLLEIRLAMALGGKAFVSLTGSVAGVRAAVEAGAALVAEKGLLVNKVVIPAPSAQLYKDYI